MADNVLATTVVGQVKNGFLSRMSSFSPAAIVVWLVLAARANKGGTTWPSVDSIQADSGLSHTTVCKALCELRDNGEIFAVSGGSRYGSKKYRIRTSSESELVQIANLTIPDSDSTIPESKLGDNISNQTHRTRHKNQTQKRGCAADIPGGLLELIDGWNGLEASVVRTGNGARRDPPAKAVIDGWNRASKNPAQREALQDISAVLAAIRGANFCHGQGWFTLPWLFGKNKNHEHNIVRLIAGAHNEEGNGHARKNGFPVGPGQRHAATPSGSGVF